MIIRFLVCFFIITSTLVAGSFYLPKKVEKSMLKKYGKRSVKHAKELIGIMNTLVNQSEKDKLVKINRFFNEIPYESDEKIWNKSDYWANRVEFMGKDRGDCEDYTFAKYFTLKQLGVASAKMRAFYCKSKTYNQAHMVLAYFRKPNTMPYILGNYNRKILPANKRVDLKPIKLYNGDDLFMAKMKKLGKSVPGSKKLAQEWIEIINGIRRR